MPTGELQRHSRSPLTVADVSIVVLALAAPALGGTTELWAQAVILFGCALLLLWSPPKTWPPLWIAWPLAGLLLISLLSFLPSDWFGNSPWRQTLARDLELALPGTLSPQPWLSLERVLVLLGTLVWAGFLAARPWTTKRSVLLSIYAGGITLLALIALICYFAQYRPPFWPAVGEGLGFFPNRNQAGNVLALGGLIALALAFHRFNRRRWSGVLWAAGYALLGVAVVVNYSRAGMGIFFLGSLTWLFWVLWQTRRLKPAALGLAGVLTALTLFLLFGGKSLERFLPETEEGGYSSFRGRFQMQAEAMRLLKQASWHGIGLGNFQAAFPGYQSASAIVNARAIHPESDWVWAAVELGWLAPLLVLAVVVGWLRKQWPRAGEPHFLLRSAIAVCALAFLLHGIVDVSGHRVGAVWPAILLLSLLRGARAGNEEHAPGATDGRRTAGESGQRTAVSGPGSMVSAQSRASCGYRGLAILLIGVAAFWLASVFRLHAWPTSARLHQVKATIERAQKGNYHDLVIRLVSGALAWAPLDRDLYFYRALAHLRSDPASEQAVGDFHRSRGLELNSTELPFVEGVAWLEREPRLTLAAWYEALARAARIERPALPSGPSRKGDLYRRMLAAARQLTGLRNDLRALAGDDRELLLIFLAQANPEEFNHELHKLLWDDPTLQTLTKDQRRAFFAEWAEMGDRPMLEEKLRLNPDWLEIGWGGLAKVLAGRNEFAEACALAQRFVAAPVLPAKTKQQSLPELQRYLLLTTNDFVTGYALNRAQMQDRDAAGALATLQKLTVQRACPKYFHYLEAQLCSQRKAWAEAWRAWTRYSGSS